MLTRPMSKRGNLHAACLAYPLQLCFSADAICVASVKLFYKTWPICPESISFTCLLLQHPQIYSSTIWHDNLPFPINHSNSLQQPLSASPTIGANHFNPQLNPQCTPPTPPPSYPSSSSSSPPSSPQPPPPGPPGTPTTPTPNPTTSLQAVSRPGYTAPKKADTDRSPQQRYSPFCRARPGMEELAPRGGSCLPVGVARGPFPIRVL